MRPGQNRRLRGRPRNKGPNPLTRSYESNGPDVKIRGTAQHIADKYAQLARDSTASGDPVSAENYHQHAEHYYRLIAAAQEQFRQQYGTQQHEDGEEGDEEGGPFGYGPNGGSANPMDEFTEGPASFEGRNGANERQPAPPPRFNDRGHGGDRPNNNRFNNDRGDRNDRFDRNGRGPNDNRGQGERFDRQGGGGERFDRQAGGERFGGNDRPDPRGGQDPRGERSNGYGQNGERFEGYRDDRRERYGRDNARPDGNGRDTGNGRPDGHARTDRPDAPRNDRPDHNRGERRDFNRDRNREPREAGRFPNGGEENGDGPAAALPAFLVNPVRTPIQVADPDVQRDSGEGYEADMAPEAPALEARPRRGRRPRRAEASENLDFGAGPSEAEKPAE